MKYSFSNYYNYLKGNIEFKRQQEIIAKIKKPVIYDVNEEVLRQKEKSEARRITQVKICQDGSIMTYTDKEQLPCYGYPDGESVWLIALYKRFIPLLAKSLKQKGIIGKFLIIASIKSYYKIFIEWVSYVFEMKRIRLKDEHYCPMVKEIRRVLKGKYNQTAIDAGTLILEYDSAYRYIVQDISLEFNKEAFLKRPLKELKRIVDIAIYRAEEGDKIKFHNIYRILSIYLLFNRKLLNKIKNIIKEIDIVKIRPSLEDRHYMGYLITYNCFKK